MFLQINNINYNSIKYDLINKFCLKNYYICSSGKKLKICFPKTILSKLKETTFKKQDLLIKILMMQYFLFSATSYIKYYPSLHKKRSTISFSLFLSLKKVKFLQIANINEIYFLKNYLYSSIFSILLKYIFLCFFKSKSKNIFIFKLIKI